MSDWWPINSPGCSAPPGSWCLGLSICACNYTQEVLKRRFNNEIGTHPTNRQQERRRRKLFRMQINRARPHCQRDDCRSLRVMRKHPCNDTTQTHKYVYVICSGLIVSEFLRTLGTGEACGMVFALCGYDTTTRTAFLVSDHPWKRCHNDWHSRHCVTANCSFYTEGK